MLYTTIYLPFILKLVLTLVLIAWCRKPCVEIVRWTLYSYIVVRLLCNCVYLGCLLVVWWILLLFYLQDIYNSIHVLYTLTMCYHLPYLLSLERHMVLERFLSWSLSRNNTKTQAGKALAWGLVLLCSW